MANLTKSHAMSALSLKNSIQSINHLLNTAMNVAENWRTPTMTKPQDLDKITRHLNERINFCKLKDNRNSRELFEALLKDFEAGKFEEDDKPSIDEILAKGKKYGYCINCDFDGAIQCEECYDSPTKIHYKPKEESDDK
jgi:hypothetical protein